ncbi:MAG: 50S ribosomal protein L19e [Candidatus Hadarchaeales archaeon]
MRLDKKKKIAAQILGVGVSRVWIDPERADEVAAALTREDIRALVKDGVIRKRDEATPSRGRWRERMKKRRAGRRRGHGSRKGASGARTPRKEKWMGTVRAVRERLRELREKGVLSSRDYRRLYRMAGGGAFKSRAHVDAYLRERGILKG